ncbi:MAG: hypothetical protein HZA91_02150 [Verrucomicrobia bacterium]|nr:hypothetical protein [Verrucomicrobiota bacterium]
MAKKKTKTDSEPREPSWPWALGLVGLVALVFWKCFFTGQLLMANDSPLAKFAREKRLLPQHFIGTWDTGYWLGQPGVIEAMPSNFLLCILSAESFARWIYPIQIAACAVLAFYWFRRMALGNFAAFFGSLVMTFAGAYFSYILPGHISKFEMTAFAVLALQCVTRAAETARWGDFIWSGVALGLAIVGAVDVGALMALLLAAWFFFSVARRWAAAGDHLRRNWVLGFLLLVLVSGVTVVPTLRMLAGAGLAKDMPGTAEAGDSSERNWNWATQWSYPPGEVVDLFAPGYHGWKTGDPQAPYWGALGRAAENYQFASPADLIKKVNNPQIASQFIQFWNFRFNSDFYGSATLVAVLLALAILLARNGASSSAADPDDWRAAWLARRRPELIFWLVVAAVALLTSFGRHFPPLFQLLHSVPPFNSMRNPNKLMIVLTPALAALAAIAMDRLWRETEPREEAR